MGTCRTRKPRATRFLGTGERLEGESEGSRVMGVDLESASPEPVGEAGAGHEVAQHLFSKT